jgi:hypothetical protein
VSPTQVRSFAGSSRQSKHRPGYIMFSAVSAIALRTVRLLAETIAIGLAGEILTPAKVDETIRVAKVHAPVRCILAVALVVARAVEVAELGLALEGVGWVWRSPRLRLANGCG